MWTERTPFRYQHQLQAAVAVRLSEAQQREMMLTAYRQTIYNALREGSEALIRFWWRR
jgi:hypothetical protein